MVRRLLVVCKVVFVAVLLAGLVVAITLFCAWCTDSNGARAAKQIEVGQHRSLQAADNPFEDFIVICVVDEIRQGDSGDWWVQFHTLKAGYADSMKARVFVRIWSRIIQPIEPSTNTTSGGWTFTNSLSPLKLEYNDPRMDL